MKSSIFFNCVLFFKIIVEVKNQPPPLTTQKTPPVQPNLPTQPPQPPPNPANRVDGMSIEDIILLGVDTNRKTEENIINTILKYSANYSSYKAVRFTTNDYLFEKASIEFDLNEGGEKGKFLFNNFKVISQYNHDLADPKYSTLIRCNSTGNTTILVDLPDIRIDCNLSVIITSPTENRDQGSISVHWINGTLMGQIDLKGNNTITHRVHSAQISNHKSRHEVEVNPKYQKLIHNHLQNISTEITRSMEKYFATQLNLQGQLIMNVTVGCTKGKIQKSNSTEWYIIYDINYDSWNRVNLTTGQAVIQGLTNFNQIDFHIRDVSFQDFNNLPCYNELSLRMITNLVSGKMKWSYNYTTINSPPLTYPFEIDYFEIKCDMKPLLDDNPALNFVQSTVEINLGKITIITSELNKSEDEKMFVSAILSDHLEFLINQWLNKTLKAELMPKIGKFDCLTDSPTNSPTDSPTDSPIGVYFEPL